MYLSENDKLLIKSINENDENKFLELWNRYYYQTNFYFNFEIINKNNQYLFNKSNKYLKCLNGYYYYLKMEHKKCIKYMKKYSDFNYNFISLIYSYEKLKKYHKVKYYIIKLEKYNSKIFYFLKHYLSNYFFDNLILKYFIFYLKHKIYSSKYKLFLNIILKK